MGVCESTEDNGEDGSQYGAAAVSTSGATSHPSRLVFSMECRSDPSRKLETYASYELEMDSKTLEIKDGDTVKWSLSYFDIIAWGSSHSTFKIVLKKSKMLPASPRQTTPVPKGQKEPTFDVKFFAPEGDGKRAAFTIRTFCLDLLADMEDAEAERKLAEKEKEWAQIMNRPDSEKGNNPSQPEPEPEETNKDDEENHEPLDELDKLEIESMQGLRGRYEKRQASAK
eukprot:TRINITY_DN17439_c0_g1_i1.p1 TRINITY_DN17439_c0_g1~~TRINITY_DN17439_c0_g1_i1.p1  ORF type:complete len:227 (+),score=57.96 TRINITY_DN17439_c0_g1_i1:173-853(+)